MTAKVEVDNELVPMTDVIRHLVGMGLSVKSVALVLDRREDEVRQAVGHVLPAPSEEELANAVRKLAKRAINHAALIMDFGTSEQQMRIVSAIIPSATRMLIGQDNDQLGEARAALERLFSDQRVQTSGREGVIDVEANSASLGTDDSDEEAGDEET